MAEPVKRRKLSSVMLHRVSKLQRFPSVPKEHTLSMPDWSLLPGDMLHLIAKNLEDDKYCFDVVHARSVCSLWRSIFPFPSCLLRPRYSLPNFGYYPYESKGGLCTLERVPLFLFRVIIPAMSPSVYYLGDLGPDNYSGDHMKLPSPLQCSARVKRPRSAGPTLMNMLDCQILPLGHQYRMVGSDTEEWTSTASRSMAFLPLNKEGGGEFVVLLNYNYGLLVLRSAEMRWMPIKNISNLLCNHVVTFRGRFYAFFLNGDVFAIDPYSLEATPLMPPLPLWRSKNYLVQSGNEELFLVVATMTVDAEVMGLSPSICTVARLDEKTGEGVVLVSDLGDRVYIIYKRAGKCRLLG